MITTLIFDWGGVLTVGKYTQSILDVLSKEKSVSIEEIYPDFDRFIVQMNEGVISFREFVEFVNDSLSFKITEDEMEDIFKRAIVPNEKMIEIIKKLHSKYKLIMLSDNDDITVKNLEKYHNKMLNLFTKKYFSHELKMRKPNFKFFKYVLGDLNIVPSECIFIDDLTENISQAREAGINSIQFSDKDSLIKDLTEYKIIIE